MTLFQSLDGQRWYQLEAIRAVNQALGRVLRHSQDYGALILCDSRFHGSATNSLSAWLQPLIFKAPSFGAFMQKLVSFFRSSRVVSEVRHFYGHEPLFASLGEINFCFVIS